MITDVEQQTDIIMKQPIHSSNWGETRTSDYRPTAEVMKMLGANVLAINLCNDSQMVNDKGYIPQKNGLHFARLDSSELIVLDSNLNLTKIRVPTMQ